MRSDLICLDCGQSKDGSVATITIALVSISPCLEALIYLAQAMCLTLKLISDSSEGSFVKTFRGIPLALVFEILGRFRFLRQILQPLLSYLPPERGHIFYLKVVALSFFRILSLRPCFFLDNLFFIRLLKRSD